MEEVEKQTREGLVHRVSLSDDEDDVAGDTDVNPRAPSPMRPGSRGQNSKDSGLTSTSTEAPPSLPESPKESSEKVRESPEESSEKVPEASKCGGGGAVLIDDDTPTPVEEPSVYRAEAFPSHPWSSRNDKRGREVYDLAHTDLSTLEMCRARLANAEPGLDCLEIDASHCRLTSEGLPVVLRFCRRAPKLRNLKLHHNSITGNLAIELDVLFTYCPLLREIHLSHNKLPFSELLHLGPTIARRYRPEDGGNRPFWLRMEHNPGSDTHWKELMTHWKEEGQSICPGLFQNNFHTRKYCRDGCRVHALLTHGRFLRDGMSSQQDVSNNASEAVRRTPRPFNDRSDSSGRLCAQAGFWDRPISRSSRSPFEAESYAGRPSYSSKGHRVGDCFSQALGRDDVFASSSASFPETPRVPRAHDRQHRLDRRADSRDASPSRQQVQLEYRCLSTSDKSGRSQRERGGPVEVGNITLKSRSVVEVRSHRRRRRRGSCHVIEDTDTQKTTKSSSKREKKKDQEAKHKHRRSKKHRDADVGRKHLVKKTTTTKQRSEVQRLGQDESIIISFRPPGSTGRKICKLKDTDGTLADTLLAHVQSTRKESNKEKSSPPTGESSTEAWVISDVEDEPAEDRDEVPTEIGSDSDDCASSPSEEEASGEPDSSSSSEKQNKSCRRRRRGKSAMKRRKTTGSTEAGDDSVDSGDKLGKKQSQRTSRKPAGKKHAIRMDSVGSSDSE